jgi:hypothetical protein
MKAEYTQLIEEMQSKRSNADHLELKETIVLYKALINYENTENSQFLEEIFIEDLNQNTSQ